MNVLISILTLILMLAIYIGIPTLIIVLIIRRKKNPRPRKPRTYRILSPLPIIINIPATFVLTYAEQSDNPLKNEDIWYAVMSIAFVVSSNANWPACGSVLSAGSSGRRGVFSQRRPLLFSSDFAL